MLFGFSEKRAGEKNVTGKSEKLISGILRSRTARGLQGDALCSLCNPL
jgi:hypothetical protein